MSTYHIPVMLNEALEFLDIKKNSWYVDCNLGGGGHTEGILKKGGKVIAIDLDNDAILEVSKNFKHFVDEKKLILVNDNFLNLSKIIADLNISQVQGILFDLGVSTHQLETANRGFSFNSDSLLDMRMNQDSISPKASDLLKVFSEKELSDLFWKLGEERFSRQIAKKIVEVRKNKNIETTNDLAQIILSVRHRSSSDRTHPATRVFQALRIAVNDELNSLKEALPQAFEVLDGSGRLVVISFHSLEDRIVKNYFKELADQGKAKILTKKPLEPTEKEVRDNPRSRSGKLRVIEKISYHP